MALTRTGESLTLEGMDPVAGELPRRLEVVTAPTGEAVRSASLSAAGAMVVFAQWSSASPGPGLVVSVVACLVGFGFAIAVEAVGTDRRDLRLGLAGLVANVVIATLWALVIMAAYVGS